MAIVTVDDLKLYLAQLSGFSDEDPFLTVVIDRAQSIVEGYLGFEYGAWGAASNVTVFAQGNSILALPPHQPGSITAVTYYGGSVIDTSVYVENAEGNLYLMPGFPGAFTLRYGPRWGTYWGTARYTVTAIWGVGPAPESVKQVVLELAKDLFFERDARSTSDIVGVEGSGGVAVGYKGALTKRQKMILDAQRAALVGGGQF